MTDADGFDERLRAIERTLTDGDLTLPELEAGADLVRRVDELERRVRTIGDRLDELDAATQSLRGYVGNVRAVNRDVERRADAALAAVESSTDEPGPIRAVDSVGSPVASEPDSDPEVNGDGDTERRVLSRLGGLL